MRLALTVAFGQDDQLIIAQQLGVEQVLTTVEEWSPEALAAARHRVEQAGLELAGVEGLPALAAGADRFAPVRRALECAGGAGIELVTYGWPLAGSAGAPRLPRGRGEALVACGPPTSMTEDQWRAWGSFLLEVEPAARRAGVRLAGAAALRTAAELERALGLHTGPWHLLDLDLGSMATWPAGEVGRMLRRLAAERRIGAVRAGHGAPGGARAFLDEGEPDLPAALLALHQAGYAGPVRATEPPGMVGDTLWGHKGRAHDLGYLRAVLQAVARA